MKKYFWNQLNIYTLFILLQMISPKRMTSSSKNSNTNAKDGPGRDWLSGTLDDLSVLKLLVYISLIRVTGRIWSVFVLSSIRHRWKSTDSEESQLNLAE